MRPTTLNMRRRHLLVAALALPLAHAVSLRDFQPVTSNLVPLACIAEYNADIDNCNPDDFNIECSRSCLRSLKRVGDDLTEKCSGVILNPDSLLGAVKNGNIVAAICPALNRVTTSTAPPTIAPPPQQTTQPTLTQITSRPEQGTTTIPPVTSSPTVSTQSSILNPPNPSFSTTKPAVSSDTTINQPPPTNVVPPTRTEFQLPTNTKISETAAATTQNRGGDNGSGGGSPFDITGGACAHGVNSMLATLIVLGWACIIAGR